MSTKKLIKALGLIIVVALLAAALPLQAKAQGGTPDTSWYGDGTATSFTLTDADDLAGLAVLVNGGNSFEGKSILLGNDISISTYTNWTPIGTVDHPFKGTFDGVGKKISDLSINNSTAVNVGLFGRVWPGTLKNVSIENVEISAKESVGSLVGSMNGTIENVHVSDVTINSTHWAGGIVGYHYGDMSDCSATDTDITLTFDTSIGDNGDKAGGLIGYHGEGTSAINNCTAERVSVTGVRDVGGLVGAAQTGNVFTNCHVSDSTVTASKVSSEHASPYAGGIIGRAAGATVTLQYSSAVDVTVTSYVEGFAGNLVGGPAANWVNLPVMLVSGVNKSYYGTIQAAVNAASDGDTILVAPGEYVENITIPAGKQLNFIGEVDAEGKPLPVIKGTLSANGLTGKTWRIENLNFVDNGGDSISLNNGGNLTVSNCTFDGAGLFLNGHRAIQANGTNNYLTVSDSTFQNGWYVSLQGNFTSLNVSNSTFTNVKSGINVQGVAGNTVTIDNSDFSVIAQGPTNDTYGVRFASSSTSGKDLTITNSSFVVDKNGKVADENTYHSAIIIRSGATGALKVENSSILGEVVNQATPVLDASPNWWGSVAGPGASQINGAVDFTPWCTDAACVNTAPDASGNVNLSGNVSVPGGILINEPGITYHLAADTVIKNSSPCFVVNADYVTIDAELGAKCIPTNGSDGIVVKAGVEGLRIVGIEITGKDSSIPNNTSGDGIHFNGDITDFQIVDNYIHDLDGSAIEFGGTPGGNTMHIQGNLFQNLGAAAIVVPTGLHPDLNAEFNSWGDYAGATLTDVDTEPYTHADFYMEYEGIIPLEKVAVGNTITYTVYGNLQNISGVDFTLKFPTAYLDATTLTNKSDFTAVPNGPDMFIVDEAAGTIRFRGAASTAPISGKKLPILEVVFTGTAAGTGAISFDQTNDVFAMSPGYGPSTWVYAAGYVDRTVEVFVDSVAPTLTSWTPAEGDIYLAEGEDFVLTVDASDDNLFSLEIDHSLEGVLPEFSVYANETDPYGGDGQLFEEAGLEVTYNSSTQTWVLTFENGKDALNAIIANHGITFYAVLHDQAGKTWGSMDPTTDENTFAYTIVFDNTPPTLDSWTPAKNATYMLTPSGDFVVTVDANDINLYKLEIDHSLEDDLPEFSVYADETDPYGGDGALFAAAGLEVTYNPSTQTWVLTFENGGDALDAIIANQGITFYAVIHDLAGNKWGSMYNITPDNTFAYTLYQQQPIARADSTGGNVEAVVAPNGNTINFTGVVAWYPADPLLGRTSGHRISVRLSAPELDFDTTDASFTFNGQTYDWTDVKDGDDYVLVYPKVTAETQSWEIVVTWGDGFSQTFTVNFNGTLGPVTAYTVDGEISMQGRFTRDTEDVIKLTGYGTDIFTADSLDKLGINYTLANVLTGEYTITTHQPRYLNITTGLAKKITLISNRTLPPLELKAGNVKDTPEDANVINLNDASMIGTAYGATGNNDADANFDLRVNIQDLALVGGNFGLTSATAYASWSPVTLP